MRTLQQIYYDSHNLSDFVHMYQTVRKTHILFQIWNKLTCRNKETNKYLGGKKQRVCAQENIKWRNQIQFWGQTAMKVLGKVMTNAHDLHVEKMVHIKRIISSWYMLTIYTTRLLMHMWRLHHQYAFVGVSFVRKESSKNWKRGNNCLITENNKCCRYRTTVFKIHKVLFSRRTPVHKLVCTVVNIASKLLV